MSLTVNAFPSSTSTAALQLSSLAASQKREANSDMTFSQIFESVRNSLESSSLGIQTGLAAIERSVKGGQSLPAQELLFYQIKAGEFGLGVELVSKLAESMLATVRRFQNGQ